MFSSWECCLVPCVMAGRTKVLGASGFAVAHRAGDTANHPPRAEKSSKHPAWPPSNLSSTLSQCLYAHFTVSVSLFIFLIICNCLSLSHHPLFFLSPCHCLTHYFRLLLHLYLSHSSSVSLSLIIYSSLLCPTLSPSLFLPPLSSLLLSISLTGCCWWRGALRFH